MEKKNLYEAPEILVFALDEFLSTADGSTEIGGEFPEIWQ